MQKRAKPMQEFWITNLSNRDVALYDLGLTIRAWSSINLLDAKHYPHLTKSIAEKSEQSGSIFKKRDKIIHRKVAPITNQQYSVSLDRSAVIPTRQHSIVEIKQEKYDELNIVEEDELLSTLTNEPTPK
jgi:hypothetical protein